MDEYDKLLTEIVGIMGDPFEREEPLSMIDRCRLLYAIEKINKLGIFSPLPVPALLPKL
jgi:hypothetical protein